MAPGYARSEGMAMLLDCLALRLKLSIQVGPKAPVGCRITVLSMPDVFMRQAACARGMPGWLPEAGHAADECGYGLVPWRLRRKGILGVVDPADLGVMRGADPGVDPGGGLGRPPRRLSVPLAAGLGVLA